MKSITPVPRDSNCFDCLRLIAALMVFYSHLFAVYGEPYHFYFLFTPDNHMGLNAGGVGVDIFFTISGFLVTGSYFNNRENLKKFFLARILRIYPAYLAQYFIVALVVGALATSTPLHAYYMAILSTPFDHIMNMFLLTAPHPLPGVFQNNHFTEINGPLWTLSYEFRMYFFIALFLWCRGIFRLNSFILWMTAFYILFLFSNGGLGSDAENLIHGMSLYCLSFLLGSLFYIYRAIIPRKFAIALLAFLLLIVTRNYDDLFGLSFSLCISYWVYYIAFHPFFAKKCRLERFGDFSYGIYIYAFPMQQYFCSLFPHDFPVYFALALTSTLCCAVVSWHCIEKNALKLKARTLPEMA